MKIAPTDPKETTELAELLKNIDNLNMDYGLALSDEMFQCQPYFLSTLFGYQLDVMPQEFNEIMKIYFLIWGYYKAKKEIPTKKITKADFEKIQLRHIQMLKYAEGEANPKEVSNIYANDLENVKSKSLWAAILLRFNTQPVLIKLNAQSKGVILVGLKSFIEFFDSCNI